MISFFTSTKEEGLTSPTKVKECEYRRLASINEKELFNLAKSRQPPSQNLDIMTYDVPIGKENSIHTLEVTGNSSTKAGKAPLVVLHGYGNGVAYLFRNVLPIAAKLPDRKVLAVDMLG